MKEEFSLEMSKAAEYELCNYVSCHDTTLPRQEPTVKPSKLPALFGKLVIWILYGL